MKRLRIAVVNAIAPPGGGSRAERWAVLCRRLKSRGHAVTLVQASLPPGYLAPETGLAAELDRDGVERVVVDPGPIPGIRHPVSGRGPGRTLKQVVGELAWPDPWGRFGVRASRILTERAGELDLVITSGPR